MGDNSVLFYINSIKNHKNVNYSIMVTTILTVKKLNEIVVLEQYMGNYVYFYWLLITY